MNILALVRPATAVAVVGLSIVGAAIYHRATASRDAARETQGSRLASKLDAAMDGMCDLSASEVRPDAGWRQRPRSRPSVCAQAETSSDRERELARIEQTLEQLTTVVVDEAVVYLAGYMAGRDEGDDTNACPASP